MRLMHIKVSCALQLFAVCLLGSVAVAQPAALRVVAFFGGGAPGPIPGMVFGSVSTPVLNNSGQTAFQANLQSGSGGVDSTNDQGIWSEHHGALQLIAREGDQASGTAPGAHFSSFRTPLLNNAGQIAFTAKLVQGSGGVTGSNDEASWSDVGGLLDVVARKGDPAPGAAAGTVFNYSIATAFNDAGQLLVTASIISDLRDGFWIGHAGSLQLVAVEGNVAPGAPFETTFSLLLGPVMNSMGEVAFYAHLSGTSGQGFWTTSTGSLHKIMRTGDAAPGTSMVFNDVTGAPTINSAGHVAFKARLQGCCGELSGVWSDTSGVLSAVAVIGDQAPGMESGVKFDVLGVPTLNNSDEIAFHARLQPSGGINENNNTGVWSNSRGSLHPIALEGDQAPGTTAGNVFASLGNALNLNQPILNGAGQVAFLAFLRTGSGDVTSSNNRGIWAEDRSGILRLIVRTGDSLDVDSGPGVELRTVASIAFSDASGNGDGLQSGFNDLGQLAFVANFTDGSSGIFVSNVAAVPEPGHLALFALLLSLEFLPRIRKPACSESHLPISKA